MWTSTLPTLAMFVGAPLLIWWLRRRGPATPGAVRVVSRTALTRNGVVAVIETDGQRFLVGATDHGISLLSELPIAEPETEPDQAPAPRPVVHEGPRTSPIEALRAMTVRKPTRPGAFRVPHRP